MKPNFLHHTQTAHSHYESYTISEALKATGYQIISVTTGGYWFWRTYTIYATKTIPVPMADFCRAVDQCTAFNHNLIELSIYLTTYKKKYSLVDLQFMSDHLATKYQEIEDQCKLISLFR